MKLPLKFVIIVHFLLAFWIVDRLVSLYEEKKKKKCFKMFAGLSVFGFYTLKNVLELFEVD